MTTYDRNRNAITTGSRVIVTRHNTLAGSLSPELKFCRGAAPLQAELHTRRRQLEAVDLTGLM
ncbi:putative selenium delivery protein YdfZ [Escherichia coli]